MAKELREYLRLLRNEWRHMPPDVVATIVEEFVSDMHNGELIYRGPGEAEEFLDLLFKLSVRDLIPRDLVEEVRGYFGLFGALPRHTRPQWVDTGRFKARLEPEVAKKLQEEKKKKEQEERQKIFQDIKQINLTENDRILFFVGAGASKPSPSNIPTVNELLPELWKKSSRMATKPLEKLETWCKENKIVNIEEMLTAITISNFIIKNPNMHGLLNSVLYPESKTIKSTSKRDIDAVLLLDSSLNTIFSLLVGTMLQANPNPIHVAIAKHAKNERNCDILTTNYDACLDQAFDENNVEYNYGFSKTEESSTLNLVKMHGSINWYYCDSCQGVFFPTIETIIETSKRNIPYPINGMCPKCNAQVNQFIIPPIAHKYLTHPPIVQIWNSGSKLFDQAKVVVIIGYSFSDADDYIAKMLVRAISQSPDKNVIIVDMEEKAIKRCISLIKNHVETFNEQKTFFHLLGDGAEIVPELLKHLKAQKAVAKTEVPLPVSGNGK